MENVMLGKMKSNQNHQGGQLVSHLFISQINVADYFF